MEDDWPPMGPLQVSPRVAHNDETPVIVIMDGDQEEILAEDVYTLHKQMLSAMLIITD